MERACKLNGVLVRAVGSSGSTARRRLRDPPSLEREIVGQVALATTSRKKENEGGPMRRQGNSEKPRYRANDRAGHCSSTHYAKVARCNMTELQGIIRGSRPVKPSAIYGYIARKCTFLKTLYDRGANVITRVNCGVLLISVQ